MLGFLFLFVPNNIIKMFINILIKYFSLLTEKTHSFIHSLRMKNPSKETGDRIRAWAIPRLVFTVCFLPEEEGILFNAKITKSAVH